MRVSGPWTTSRGLDTGYSYDDANELTASPTSTYGYDDLGELIDTELIDASEAIGKGS
jgi:hypothetical protein